MRIVGARIFLSFLAGKFKILKQMLSTWHIYIFFKNFAHAYLWRPYFSKSFGGKIAGSDLNRGDHDRIERKNYSRYSNTKT